MASSQVTGAGRERPVNASSPVSCDFLSQSSPKRPVLQSLQIIAASVDSGTPEGYLQMAGGPLPATSCRVPKFTERAVRANVASPPRCQLRRPPWRDREAWSQLWELTASLGRLYFLRAEEKHEHRPEQGEEPPASRCYRCCDPGAPLYQAIPVPQINITILKGQAEHKGPSPGGGGAALS